MRLGACTFNQGRISILASKHMEDTMDLITALAVSIGLLGGVATYLFLTVGMLQIWAAFIGWASYYHCGGQTKGLQDSIAGAIWGSIMAAAAFALMNVLGLPGALGAAVAVAITVAVMILGAKVPILSSIPAAVYGYASTVALTLLGKDVLGSLGGSLLAVPAVNIALSMIVGAIFGYISQQLAGALSK
jgi:Protein of unknown function (DUF1097)